MPHTGVAHRVLLASLAVRAGDEVTIDGEEARHAIRVKRVRIGERIEVMDGRGSWGGARVESVEKGAGGSLTVRMETVEYEDRPARRIEVWSACPRPDRLEQMIDQLSQVGAGAWRPLTTRHAEHRLSGARRDRLLRIAGEAAKQCGRRWLLEIGDEVDFASAVSTAGSVFADGGGVAPGSGVVGNALLCVGPEGGWAREEREAMVGAGRPVWRLGPHVMRLETAVVAGACFCVTRAAE